MAGKLTLQSVVRLSSGFDIPLLGLGVYQNIEECLPASLAALNAGYRHIDSAVMYRNEDQVGEALKQSKLKREEVFLTTKISSRYHGYDTTAKLVDTSLAKFGTNYIDLYLIHDPLSGKAKRLDTWKALVDAKKAGKIRSIGVSNYSGKHIDEIKAEGLELPSVNQIELHPLCQQKPIVEYCKANGILVEAYCPIIRGQFDQPVFHELASKYKKDPAQVLIRWSLQKGFSPLPKSAHAERIKSNADVYDFELSSEDVAKLDALDKGDAGAISWNPVNAD
ncbi:Aldo/keto reductase [Sistotremastrum niveocremeum HHB9708]|uniref:Aldo/keto reductase n=2 Tax=Sistotremastraceae TaxID=3402574 RepID=A0A164Q259_9AGAM|nr:Aldo/keto reductase [Sistotremastrum niveocremeum HHB9708]KZT35858.1 Aldo/keto reductase [Sistotremastrum suecicum HHB10207 ss-3]